MSTRMCFQAQVILLILVVCCGLQRNAAGPIAEDRKLQIRDPLEDEGMETQIVRTEVMRDRRDSTINHKSLLDSSRLIDSDWKEEIDSVDKYSAVNRRSPTAEEAKRFVEKQSSCSRDRKMEKERYASSFAGFSSMDELSISNRISTIENYGDDGSSNHDENQDVTLCWIETTTIFENTRPQPPIRVVIREYSVTVEYSATIPDEYLECTKYDNELNEDDPEIGRTGLFKVIDENTKRSRMMNFTMISSVNDTLIWMSKKVKCATGPLVTRSEFSSAPDDKIEFKVSPKLRSLDIVYLMKEEDETLTSATTTVDFNDSDDASVTNEELVSVDSLKLDTTVPTMLVDATESTTMSIDLVTQEPEQPMVSSSVESEVTEATTTIKIDTSAELSTVTPIITDVTEVFTSPSIVHQTYDNTISTTLMTITPGGDTTEETILSAIVEADTSTSPSALTTITSGDDMAEENIPSTIVEEVTSTSPSPTTTTAPGDDTAGETIPSTIVEADISESLSPSTTITPGGDTTEENIPSTIIEADTSSSPSPSTTTTSGEDDTAEAGTPLVNVEIDTDTSPSTMITVVDDTTEENISTTIVEADTSTTPSPLTIITSGDNTTGENTTATTITPPRKLTLRVKVLLEHMNEQNETENLVEVDKCLEFNETSKEQDRPRLIDEIRSLNDTVNEQTMQAMLNCTVLDKLTKNTVGRAGKRFRRHVDNTCGDDSEDDIISDSLPEEVSASDSDSNSNPDTEPVSSSNSFLDSILNSSAVSYVKWLFGFGSRSYSESNSDLTSQPNFNPDSDSRSIQKRSELDDSTSSSLEIEDSGSISDSLSEEDPASDSDSSSNPDTEPISSSNSFLDLILNSSAVSYVKWLFGFGSRSYSESNSDLTSQPNFNLDSDSNINSRSIQKRSVLDNSTSSSSEIENSGSISDSLPEEDSAFDPDSSSESDSKSLPETYPYSDQTSNSGVISYLKWLFGFGPKLYSNFESILDPNSHPNINLNSDSSSDSTSTQKHFELNASSSSSSEIEDSSSSIAESPSSKTSNHGTVDEHDDNDSKMSDDVFSRTSRETKQRKHLTKEDAIRNSLSGIHRDILTGFHRTLSHLDTSELKTRSSSEKRAAEVSKSGSTDVEANPQVGKARYRDKRATLEELNRWSNERFAKTLTGKLRSLTEFKLYKVLA